MAAVVEAFLDSGRDDDDSLLVPSYIAGYRLVETGEVICTVKLPAPIAEAEILKRSKISVTMTPSGSVEVSSGGSAVNEQIDDLVARTVIQTNLRMEEANASDLKSLLHRLERSLVFVQEAIERMPTSSELASVDRRK